MGNKSSLGAAQPCGFTLVQLLVAFAILGFLFALLANILAGWREAAISTHHSTCRRNMRDLAMALVAYEARHNVFPSLRNTVPNTPHARSAIFVLLPYLERMDLYNHAATGGAGGAALTHAELEGLNTYLVFMQCPSNPQPKTSNQIAFVFNAGRFGLVDRRAAADFVTAAGPVLPAVPERYAGTFFEVGNSSTAELSAGDGATHTLLLSETLVAPRWTSRIEREVGFTWGMQAGQPLPATAGINREKTISGRAPASNHPRVVNVAFADTHVRTIADAIDYRVYAQLCAPNDEAFDLPQLHEGE